MLSKELSQHIEELAGQGQTPLAVAFSGGGDSTALLSLVIDTFKHQSREIHALIIDHGLRDGSDAEAQLAASRAHAMGAQVYVMRWDHADPSTGIQEKARQARYDLMGDACRRLGIQKLFLGHNRDDQAETVLMRSQKRSGWRGLAGMQARVLAPIWPQLRNIEVLRPLLGETRESLRKYNDQNQLSYIDDPTNENRDFDRIRARDELQKSPKQTEALIAVSRDSQIRLLREKKRVAEIISANVEFEEWGGVILNQNIFKADDEMIAATLRYILPAVGGQGGFPQEGKLGRLVSGLNKPAFKGATLSGTRLVRNDGDILIVRDPGMVLGRSGKPALGPINLNPDQPVMWDSRFLIETSTPDIHVLPAGAVWDQIDRQTKNALKVIPLVGRKTLPVFMRAHTIVTIPFLKPSYHKGEVFTAKSMIKTRLDGFLSV